MDDSARPPPLTVVRPGEGRLADLGGGLGVAFKLWGQDSGGSVAVVERPFAVGTYVPALLHTREDEYSIVTEGEIGFRSGEREVVLGAGATSPSRAESCTRGGTPGRCPRA